MRHKTLVAMAVSWVAVGASAQAEDLVFVTGGMGAGSLGIAGIVSVQVASDKWSYGLRASTVQEFNILGPSPAKSDTDYALLFGRLWRGRRSLRWVSTGAALVHSVRRGRRIRDNWLFGSDYQPIVHDTIGLPIDLGAARHAKGVVGVGVHAFGNINTANSFAGVALTVQLGKLR